MQCLTAPPPQFDLTSSVHFLQGWPMYAQLLIDLFKYIAPFLRNVELSKPMQILYKVQHLHLVFWLL